jgi:uncharacterized protein
MRTRIRLGWTTLALLALAPGFLPAQNASLQKPFADRLADAAMARTRLTVRYDPAYVVLDYPGGDVAADTGVCTDEVIRSYRALGVDFQLLVHEDMKRNFSCYPKLWGMGHPDKNIDHRRVPNLQRFLERRGASLPITSTAVDYRPGDLVAWDLNGKGLTHIGIVVATPAGKTGEGWVVHNIGAGPQCEPVLFGWKVIGHYRFGG